MVIVNFINKKKNRGGQVIHEVSQSKHGEPNTKNATTKKYTEKNDTEKIQIKYATKI